MRGTLDVRKGDPMLDAHLSEELEIMEQQARPARQLDAETFERPIADLCRWTLRSVKSSATIGDAVAVMQRYRVGALLVVDDDQMRGIVTERDLLMKVLGKIPDYAHLPITTIMTANPTWLLKEDAIKYAVHHMHVGGYRHIPVLDEHGHPAHIVSVRDVLGYIAEHFPQEVLNVASEPTRTSSPPDVPGS